MYRAYQVGLNKGGNLVLAGAYNGKWTDVDFVAKCNAGAANDGQSMSQRMHQSKVFLPGELAGNKRRDDQVLAHRRCKMHLETGTCSCGIWGYMAPARVQREYLTTPFWTGSGSTYGSSGQVQVLCAVRVFGTVLVGEFGYRASNGRIEAMYVPSNIEMYAQRNSANLEPLYDAHSMSFFRTAVENTTASVSRRIDPDVVWRKISQSYNAAIVLVDDGVEMIQTLDVDCPDPILKPIGSLMPTFGEEDEYDLDD